MVEAMAKFSKVSFEQFVKDCNNYIFWGRNEDEIRKIYDNIKLPKRATMGSAGYDFFVPCDIVIKENNTCLIPTGIRCEMKSGWVLCMFPRSGLGFKYGVSLANTVGIIDEDYAYSENEGHIMIKLSNESILSDRVELTSGKAFCQGIFLPFGITYDDNTTKIRNGGFGSTDKNVK